MTEVPDDTTPSVSNLPVIEPQGATQILDAVPGNTDLNTVLKGTLTNPQVTTESSQAIGVQATIIDRQANTINPVTGEPVVADKDAMLKSLVMPDLPGSEGDHTEVINIVKADDPK
jgi:hypothetical protein